MGVAAESHERLRGTGLEGEGRKEGRGRREK